MAESAKLRPRPGHATARGFARIRPDRIPSSNPFVIHTLGRDCDYDGRMIRPKSIPAPDAASASLSSAALAATQAARQPEAGGPYARYVLAVLVLVYVFNFIDRNIVSILAEQIKADLGLSDAQIGFLYGTAFAVFYAVFGIPLGAVADAWDRRRLIAIGLALWSGMTAVSGLARSFAQLGLARIGVGIGESSATPAAYSLLSDYFPPSRRTTALALYAGGINIGAGAGVFLGGWILEFWQRFYPNPADAPWGLKGWQVAYFAVGLPGLLMALWVRTLREPVRGISEGQVHLQAVMRPLGVFARELFALLPGTSLVSLRRAGASPPALALNGVVAAVLLVACLGMIALLGTPPQWIALGLGLFAAFAWAQGIALRDRASFRVICGSRALRYGSCGFGFLAFTGYGYAAFTPPFFLRLRGASPGEVAIWVSLGAAVGGWLGTMLSGVLSDALLHYTRRARLYVAMLAALLPIPCALTMLSAQSKPLAYAANCAFATCLSLWFGPGPATVQGLVLPRMRATASAAYLLVLTLIGLALGPYTIGRISQATGSLDGAMRWCLFANALGLFFLILSARHLVRDEDSRMARAQAAGEPAPASVPAASAA
jgi:MFS family permease